MKLQKYRMPTNCFRTYFGSVAPALFAIALIAAGQSSTVTGTLAGQIVMEGHIKLRIQPWLRRLITRLLAIIPAFFTILYFGNEALGGLLILSQVSAQPAAWICSYPFNPFYIR